MKEKIQLLALGTVVTVITFLVAAYTGSFITRAEYNKDQTAVKIIQNDLQYLKQGQKEIKDILKSY